MQKLWSISGRSIAVSALALALTACQSMRGPEPVAQANIPEQGYLTSNSGPSIAEQGYKDFFADQRLLQVLDLALANNRDLRTSTLNIQRAQQQYQMGTIANVSPRRTSAALFCLRASSNTSIAVVRLIGWLERMFTVPVTAGSST